MELLLEIKEIVINFLQEHKTICLLLLMVVSLGLTTVKKDRVYLNEIKYFKLNKDRRD